MEAWTLQNLQTIDQEPRVQLSTMETSSPVKRKAAAINLTRSDSEDEAPKRRVIDIESDDDDEQPWERPEWKAKCEAERNDDVVKTVAALARASFGFTIADACDEEMWREVNDPPGHARMLYTRAIVNSGKDPSNPATAKKIRKMADEKLAEDAAAALEGKYAPYHFKRMGGIRE